MGQKDYTKFSECSKKSENKNVIEEAKTEMVNDGVTNNIEEITNEVTKEERTVVTGIVTGCEKLNVRKGPSPNAEILCVLNKGDEVQVDLGPIDDKPVPADVSFYQVYTASGVEGYCMTEFITIK